MIVLYGIFLNDFVKNPMDASGILPHATLAHPCMAVG
jgi:hypothetical protein